MPSVDSILTWAFLSSPLKNSFLKMLILAYSISKITEPIKLHQRRTFSKFRGTHCHVFLGGFSIKKANRQQNVSGEKDTSRMEGWFNINNPFKHHSGMKNI